MIMRRNLISLSAAFFVTAKNEQANAQKESAPALAADGHSTMLDVSNFGAKGDGKTDDSEAFNKAVDYIRENSQLELKGVASIGPSLQLGFAKTYFLSKTWNLASIRWLGCTINGNSSTIISGSNGTPAIDALNSRFLSLRNLTVVGSETRPPSTGLQFGRALKGIPADLISLFNVTLVGSFQLSAVYNLGSEGLSAYHCRFWNSHPGASYALIQDGINLNDLPHQSAALDALGVQPDSRLEKLRPMSFNENLFSGCDFRSLGNSGVPLWLIGGSRLSFQACYALTSAPIAVILDCRYIDSTGVSSFRLLELDLHCEAAKPDRGIGSIFRFQGVNSARQPGATIRGFHWREHNCVARNSIFSIESSGLPITSSPQVIIEHANLEVPACAFTPQLFDDSKAYSVKGTLYSDTLNVPAQYGGLLKVD